MAKRASQGIRLELPAPNEKQRRFFLSRCRYTAYGGARGGGKTWAVRCKAAAGALRWPGIRILILRRTYPELESTLISPMLELLGTARKGNRPAGEALFTYHATTRTIRFVNGSTIRFGHLQNAGAITEYQGQEYDWIFMDEATHFTEWEFRVLSATLRGVRPIPKRFYLTCNPGGVGHAWVKRLFIQRQFREGEEPEEYAFIPATVEDNRVLLESSPEYVRLLDQLPEDIRAAHRYGDWDVMAGQFFPEFSRQRHGFAPFPIPEGWRKYRAMDYGLDMLACLWIAVDPQGRGWVYRELKEPGLIVSRAAGRILEMTPEGEKIEFTLAPPDLWSTQKDTGRTMAERFAQNGVGLVRANNSRVQGWMTVKEALSPREDGRPGLLVSEDCGGLFRDLSALRHDEKNPSDCATEPHDVTHICDALRYFCQGRVLGTAEGPAEESEESGVSGEVSGSYLWG